jgi:DnaJ-domain-containing protein 1
LRALLRSRLMNESSETIARWLEQIRRRDRAWATVIFVLALSCGAAVFLLTSVLVYALVYSVTGGFLHSAFTALVAAGLTAWSYARIMKSRRHELDVQLDPMGWWIIRDLLSIGPRLLLEGLHQRRRCGQLDEFDVQACARILTYLAGKNAAVGQDELLQNCAQVSWERLREQLSLLDGVLFLGEHGTRVTLMEPFRLLLRTMLPREPQTAGKRPEPARPRPEPPPDAIPVNEPEQLSAYEILGLPPSASWLEIKTAYRKRIKACHPDLFAGTGEQTMAVAERWTKALNAAYATLNPRQRGSRPETRGW